MSALQPYWRSSLRVRVAVAMLLVASIGSISFAVGVFAFNERFEELILERQVSHELETLVLTASADPATRTVRSALLTGYAGQDNPDLPDALRSLGPGRYHGLAIGEELFQVEVSDRNSRRFYISYDITAWETQEWFLVAMLFAGVFFVIAATIWLASWASRQVLAPITTFAKKVAAMRPEQRNVRLATEFEGEEVSEIALAFDRFMIRLDGFVDREQSFTASASHELRTPLAVLQGATEVLLEQRDLNNTSTRAVQRIQRASREMNEFINALLLLSRETEPAAYQGQATDIGQIALNLTADLESLRPINTVPVKVDIRSPLHIKVAPSLPTIVLSNLLRNALEHTHIGCVSMVVDRDSVTISDSGDGMSRAQLEHAFDRSYSTKPGNLGLGLNIVKRICAQCGWHIAITSEKGTGTDVILTFHSDRLLDPQAKHTLAS